MGKAPVTRLHLRYVSADTDRHGNVRYYFRKRGQQKMRLPGRPGDAEFMAAYHEALSGAATQSKARRTLLTPGSLRWLAGQYLASRQFAGLADGTRRWQRSYIDDFCSEPVADDGAALVGDLPAHSMPADAIRKLRERKARAAGANAANHRLKVLRAIFRYGVEAGLVQYDPAREVRKVEARSDGHHTWTPDEVAQFETHHPIGSKARLALALLLYTGARRSDVILLGRQHVTDGWLCWTCQKGRNRKPVRVEIPILPDLQHIIDESPTGDLTFLISGWGRPFTASGFGARFRTWCDAADLPHCTPHGLRKAGACRAAENGATEKQLMAIFGWTAMQHAELDTRAASRRRLASDAAKLLRLRTDQE